MTTRELIQIFLDKYCTTHDFVLDHFLPYTSIEYNEQVYFVPDHDFEFTVDDDILREMLIATYKI